MNAVVAVDVVTANRFFLVLTLVANVGVAAWLVGRRPRWIVAAVGSRAVSLAAVVATVTTAGSLYYSEIADYTPCVLCWYQRICMYPLVVVLVVGALRRDRGAWKYAAPFVIVGAPLSLYHWLVERVPVLSDSVACSASAPCTVPYFEELGYVTLAFMALSAFVLIGVLLAIEARHQYSFSRLGEDRPS